MPGGIYLIQDGGELVEMVEQPYDSEQLLQALLAQYPSLLAGDLMDSRRPRRWLLISRETPIPDESSATGRWALDHLFVDQDAVPTLVEVKHSRDSRLRREVVGQMLDYAAHAVSHWGPETIRQAFETRCSRQDESPEVILAEFLGDDTGPEVFWTRVETNLRAGRIRMVFVADEIPSELSEVVAFLQRQMRPAEVIALEIRQYAGQGLRTLVPRLVGQGPVPTQEPPAPSSREWNSAVFLQELEAARGPQETAAARAILRWAQQEADRVTWSGGAAYGAFRPVLDRPGREFPLFAVSTTGQAEVSFYWFARKPPLDAEDLRLDLLNRLNLIPGLSLPANVISGLPTVPLALLDDESKVQQFLAAFSWLAREIRKA